MNNMTVRALSGAVYIGIIIACCLLGFNWFCVLCMAFAILALNELENLLDARVHFGLPARVLDLLLVCAMFWLIYGSALLPGFTRPYGMSGLMASLVLLFAYLPLRMCVAVADKKGGHPAGAAMGSVFAITYTALPMLMLLATYSVAAGKMVLATFVMIWLNDTGAYLSGRTFGRTKLCERLSPKKTWEGFWGGFALCVAAGVAYPLIFMPGTHAGWIAAWAAYGAAVSAASTVGDLFESLIKRTLGVKDSGRLIPGHGGILDRIDSLLAVAPLSLIFVLCRFLF